MVTVAPAVQETAAIQNEFPGFNEALRVFYANNQELHNIYLEEFGPKVLRDLGLTDLTGRVEQFRGMDEPKFMKKDKKKHVSTSIEAKRDNLGKGKVCDVEVAFDGDPNSFTDPTVSMLARWRQGEAGEVEMTNVLIGFKKRGHEGRRKDIEVWFNPNGQMTGLKATDEKIKDKLWEAMRLERQGDVNQGEISFADNDAGFETACNFLALQTGLSKEIFQDGFDVRATIREFITTGTVQEKDGAVSPVIVRKAR
ncbi:MAG: hypothetical protein V1810_02330 [Candidatus Beckwithbacteria bacterium]